jgi:sugar lactone lactonase YvrE
VYINDSLGQKMYAYDFDLESGAVSNKRLLTDVRGTVGELDGMILELV